MARRCSATRREPRLYHLLLGKIPNVKSQLYLSHSTLRLVETKHSARCEAATSPITQTFNLFYWLFSFFIGVEVDGEFRPLSHF